jgi:hypothetical protein
MARSKIARTVAIAAGAAALLALVIPHSLWQLTKLNRPDVASQIWPLNGISLSSQADRLLMKSNASAADIARAKLLSVQALSTDILNPRALRTIAYANAANGKYDLATRQMQLTGRLDRRDLATRFWLIEDAVRRENLPDALDQYDLALRSSKSVAATLFPKLDLAMGVPEAIAPLARIFDRQPWWLVPFVNYAIGSGKSVRNLTILLLKSPERLAKIPLIQQQSLLTRLIAAKEFANAETVFMHVGAKRRGVSRGEVHDANFNIIGYFPPFDWQLTSTAKLTVSPIGDGQGLDVNAESNVKDRAARQLVKLEPGSYQLASEAITDGGAPNNIARWTLSCAESNADPLAIISFDTSVGNPQHVSADVDIPQGQCRYWWLGFNVVAAADQASFHSQIRWLSLRRL